MNGIASLAPGQAPQQAPQGPQQGAPTPQAVTGQLKNMPLEQLRMFLMNPGPNSPPLWAVISAVAEKQKEAQAMQMAQGQQVMAQNAQMQQQPPVAAQVVQAAEQMGESQQRVNPEQQLRQRLQSAINSGRTAEANALMDMLKELEQSEFTEQEKPQRYAGGGAVAFNRGGNVQYFSNGADEFGLIADPEAEAMDALRVERAQKEKQLRVEREQKEKQLKTLEETYYSLMMQNDPRAAKVKQQLDALSGRVTAPVAPAITSAPMRMQDTRGGTPEMAALAQMLGGAATAPSPAPAAPRRQPAAGPAPAAPLTPTATPATLTPELQTALKEQEDRLRGRLTRPESLTKAEEGLAALAKSNIAAQQAEAKTYGEEIRAARDAALARAQRDITSDPMSLLALAGSIDTRKGQGIGSLARGAAGLMGEREKQAEAARKEFALAQRDERAMQANIRQTQMLEAQRQVALEKGKLDEVNAINDQLSNLAIEREKFRLTRGDVAFNQAMEGRKVAADEERARAARISAGKPDATLQLLQALFPGQAPSVENLAKIAAAQYGPRLGAKEMTYDQASDNVQKLLDSTYGMMEVNAIKKRAREAGQPEPSILEIKDMLIQRELQGAGAKTSPALGSQAAPPVGTVMQGYRFKGGNPADRNNWEKV